jgi:hypothetical protein
MQQVLEALESVTGHFTRTPSTLRDSEVRGEAHKAITALRERLTQPEQEPVDSAEKAEAYLDARLWEFIDMAAAWPEAKPDPRIWGHVMVYAPKQPSKPWVGLTDEEIQDLGYLSEKFDASNSEWFDRWGFARAIEAKLKEKNDVLR